MSELTIGLILPDVLGTYGDNGNALVLRGRARKRGIDTEVVTIKLGEPVPTNLDLYCVGGGEDTAQILAALTGASSTALDSSTPPPAPLGNAPSANSSPPQPESRNSPTHSPALKTTWVPPSLVPTPPPSGA